ncbi:hypothetical protein, partial [Nioella sp.]|uniref:hypothetical protein n=1 Tax=Nioella sp. TaxID=1912091 RepID=UPI0035143042
MKMPLSNRAEAARRWLWVRLVLSAVFAGVPSLACTTEDIARFEGQWYGQGRVRPDADSASEPMACRLVFDPGAGDDLSQWLSRQSRLVLDLRLTPGVGDVQSLFSLREIEGDGMAPLFDPQTDSLTPGELAQIADRRPDVALFLEASGPVS